MTAWFDGLSKREQILVGVAGALALLFAASFLVIRPLAAWRSDAAAQAQSAQSTFKLVTQAAASGGGVATPAAPNAGVPLRNAVTQSSASAGIELLRIGADAGGQIEVQPAPTDGERLFAWLGVLQQQFGVSVAFADMSRDENGLVSAQVLVFERSGS